MVATSSVGESSPRAPWLDKMSALETLLFYAAFGLNWRPHLAVAGR